MTSLTFLNLSSNEFGLMPDWLGKLTSLTFLDLSKSMYLFNNQLSGSIPDSIEQLSKLESIDLSDNQLNGSIPNSFGQLSKLKSMDLSYNQLSGRIPNSIGKLSNLETLLVDDNSLEGVISEAHFANLSKLTKLNIGVNNLNCEMKSDWRPPFHLKYIFMESCKFGIGFPEWL
ncbi:hypothetical protein SLA2020_103640 [Shorea laevis]